MCSRRSCDPYYFEVDISTCITQNYLAEVATESCLQNITNCSEFYACRGVRYSTLSDCPVGATAACDSTGTIAVDCTNNIVTNCTTKGGTCGTYIDQDSGVPAVGCRVVSSCADKDGLQHCAGNVVYTCENGVGYGTDCTKENSNCDPTSPSCWPDGTPCANSGSTPLYACVAGNLQVCDANGKQFTAPCQNAGLSCAVSGGGTIGNCVDPNCGSGCTTTCGADGKTLTACVGGAPYPIDCTQYGFKNCATNTNDEGQLYGWCY